MINSVVQSVVKSVVSSIGGVSGGSGSPVMPAGAIGLWFAKDYVAEPRPHIPNRNSTAPPTANVRALPRRNFANGHAVVNWALNGGSVTDMSASAPDGSNDASEVTAAGDWYLSPSSVTVPAGDYYVAVTARSDEIEQRFKIGDFNSTVSATQTLDATWRRYGHPITTTGVPFPVLISFDRATGIDMQVIDYEMYEGSVDLGPFEPDGHLYLSVTKYSTPAPCSDGEIDFTDDGYGLISLPTQTYSAFTSFCTTQKFENGNNNFHAFLSLIRGYGTFSNYIDSGPNYFSQMGKAAAQLGGQSCVGKSGLWQLYDAYSVIAYRFDGVTFSAWCDGILHIEVEVSAASAELSDLFSGLVENPTYTSGAKINAIALYDRALDDSEMESAFVALKANAESDGLTMRDGAFLIALGDSLTAGFGLEGGSYVEQYVQNSTQTLLSGVNLSASGTGLTYVETAMVPRVESILSARSGKKNIVSILVGDNDLSTLDAPGIASYVARYSAVCDSFRAAGALVAIGTVPPRNDLGPTYNINRAAVNAIYRTWVGVHVDAIFDVAANANIGPDAAASNPTYYMDGVHWTDAGNAEAEISYRAAINSL